MVMLYENDHASRVIHLDGRAHPGPAFRFFMGDSIGRWEGNTLVVDTTNLNGKGSFGRLIPYYSDAMHTVERFAVAAPDRIDYEIVYDDPKLFTRPFKSVGYFFPADDGYELREETCVEGSYTLRTSSAFERASSTCQAIRSARACPICRRSLGANHSTVGPSLESRPFCN